MLNDEFGANVEWLETTLKSAQAEFQRETNESGVTVAIAKLSSAHQNKA